MVYSLVKKKSLHCSRTAMVLWDCATIIDDDEDDDVKNSSFWYLLIVTYGLNHGTANFE